MRTRIVIQSRLSSSRLPGKALMTIGGMPLIELVVRRASRSDFDVVVATSVESYDDRIVAALEPKGFRVIRGPLDDVLSRFVAATSDMDETDRVVRLTGDNPVTDSDLVQDLIDEMDRSDAKYGRVDLDVVPEGLSLEVFTVELLRRASREAVDAYDHEHVTPWIRRHTDELLFEPARNPGQPVVFRATVDCLHDFIRISHVFDSFEDPVQVHWADVMDSLAEQVRALGPIATEAPEVERRLTSLILSTQNIGRKEGTSMRQSWKIREVFTRAVEAGVSDVICSPEDANVVAIGMIPMLNRRMGVSLALPSVCEEDSPTTHLRYLIERVRAESQTASLRTVFLDCGDIQSEYGPALICVLEEFRSAGIVSELGVQLHQGSTLSPDRAPVDVAAGLILPGMLDTLKEWRDAGHTTMLFASGAESYEVNSAMHSGSVDTVVTSPRNVSELTSMLAVV